MPTATRQFALKCLLELDHGSRTIASVIDVQLRQAELSDVDAALLTELVYGVTRWRGRLDWIISQLVRREPDRAVRQILRLGLYQLLLMDRIPEHAVLHETVELARECQKGFVNAVLRNAQRRHGSFAYPSDPIDRYAVTHSFPRWIISRWLDTHGEAWTQAFCEASNKRAPLDLRVNMLRASRTELLDALNAEGHDAQPLAYTEDGVRLAAAPPIRRLEPFKKGWCIAQDHAAMLVTEALAPQPGETVVDICAAPGGKTTHIAQRMRGEGVIIAVDVSSTRLKRLTANCQRLGIPPVRTYVRDARRAIPELLECADRVLVDVPCSGFGTMRRHPDIRWRRQETELVALPAQQLEILRTSAQYVRPDGVLVYSTCTVEPGENQCVIERFLDEATHFRRVSPVALAPFCDAEGTVQTWPHVHQMDGFFIATLCRFETRSKSSV